MTRTDSAPPENRFVTRRLPWWIGGGALLFYFVSLNHWISLGSLETVTRLSGWRWQPEIGRPLTLTIFGPLKLLPASWLPVLANCLTAICAALALGQLARSVAILRQDVAPNDPLRKNKLGPAILTGPLAWLPPVLAVLVCGLQQDFWEHATAASGEMLSLLCFAIAFRCVLEFRIEARDKWLYRGAFAFALGATDNALMIAYLPAFIAAVIWVRGYGACLNWRFLLRLTGGALLGFSLYLLVPTLLCATAPGRWDFWPALKAELAIQKHALQIFRISALRLLVVTAPLPFVLLAVRWRSHTVQLADDTHVGVFFSKASGHFIHTFFFIAAIWMAFEPTIVPRQIEIQTPLLLYRYTWALVAGHCSGYLLLFGKPAGARLPVRWPSFAALALVTLLPLILLWKNLGAIRLTNGGALREFIRQLADDLPAGKATVLSDETRQLLLLRAELVARGKEPTVMFVDTRSLPWPEYHWRMATDYGARWPDVVGTNRVESVSPAMLLNCIRQIATNEPVAYLHPSSGFFFEDFVAEPNGWIQRLVERTWTNAPRAEGLTDAVVKNERIWQERWTKQLAARAAQFENHRQHAARWAHAPLKSLRLAGHGNETETLLAGAYSKLADYWGVQAQRAGLESEAQEWFRRAIVFDADNLAACLNLEFATRRQQGDTNRITVARLREAHPKLLARFERWADVISRNGPVDEPTFLFHTGRMYLAANNPRQALEAFERSAELADDWVAPKLAQAQCQNLLGRSAAALALTEALTAKESQLKGPQMAQLLQVRAAALWRTGQTNEATAYIERVAAQRTDQLGVLLAAAEFYTSTGQFLAELKWREALLQRDPKRLDWIVKKGHAELRGGEFEAAITTLTQALTLEPANANARLFRAVAALRAGKLETARRDYDELLKNPAHTPNALFGLGEIAWREHDTNAMILYYQAFLTNNAVISPQAALANQRLKDWQDE